MPDDVWNMVIDGSDTSQWGIPHPASRTYESQKRKKMGCNVYSVTTKCVHITFLKLRAHGKKFPPRLYLQHDNFSKHNKNRFVVACLYMLVCCGCFGKIDIFIVKVGLTHCEQLCHHLFNFCGIIEIVEMVESLVPWQPNVEDFSR